MASELHDKKKLAVTWQKKAELQDVISFAEFWETSQN